MSNWISIEDRLPDLDEWVTGFQDRRYDLILKGIGSEDTKVLPVMFGGFDSFDTPLWNQTSLHYISDITHWQPLPEPPTT